MSFWAFVIGLVVLGYFWQRSADIEREQNDSIRRWARGERRQNTEL